MNQLFFVCLFVCFFCLFVCFFWYFPAPSLSHNELADVLEEILASSTKWYEIGLQLKFSVDKLDGITSQFIVPRHCLREMLKVWLKGAAGSKPTWGTLVEALRSQTVGEPELADQLAAKYCQSRCLQLYAYIIALYPVPLTHTGESSWEQGYQI